MHAQRLKCSTLYYFKYNAMSILLHLKMTNFLSKKQKYWRLCERIKLTYRNKPFSTAWNRKAIKPTQAPPTQVCFLFNIPSLLEIQIQIKDSNISGQNYLWPAIIAISLGNIVWHWHHQLLNWLSMINIVYNMPYCHKLMTTHNALWHYLRKANSPLILIKLDDT